MSWQGDVILIIVFFLVVPTIVLFTLQYASGILTGVFANTPIIHNSPGYNESLQVAQNFNIFNTMIPFLVFGLLIINLILGAYISVNPQNFVLGLLGMIVITVASFYISNAAYAIISVPILAPVAAKNQTLLTTIDNIPVIVTLFDGFYLVVILLAYYRRKGRE